MHLRALDEGSYGVDFSTMAAEEGYIVLVGHARPRCVWIRLKRATLMRSESILHSTPIQQEA